MHLQLHNQNLFKMFFGTKSLNTKQCPAGLSPRIKPLPIKNDPSVDVALLPPLDVDCPPFLLTFVGNPEE